MATYNTYDFDQDTPFIPLNCCKEHCSVDLEAIKDCIGETINDNLDEKFEDINSQIKDAMNENLDDKFIHINHHINHATGSIIKEIRDGNKEICLCNIATKKDIVNAVNDINTHIDDKFDEIDFMKQFDNLNNQIKNINND